MAEKKTIKKPQAWQVRKIIYGLAAILVGVLGWAGVLSDIKADQIMDHVDQWLPILLGVLAPALAASKTHEGSDSTATEADVESATATVADRVQDAVRDALTAASIDPTQIGQAVVTAIRAEERGDHDATATASAVDTDYVYGR